MQSNQKQAGSAKYRHSSKVGLGTSGNCTSNLIPPKNNHARWPLVFFLFFFVNLIFLNRIKQHIIYFTMNEQEYDPRVWYLWLNIQKKKRKRKKRRYHYSWHPALIQREISWLQFKLVSNGYLLSADGWHGKQKKKKEEENFKRQLHYHGCGQGVGRVWVVVVVVGGGSIFLSLLV